VPQRRGGGPCIGPCADGGGGGVAKGRGGVPWDRLVDRSHRGGAPSVKQGWI